MGRAGLPAYHRGQLECGLPAKFQDDGSKEKTLLVWRTLGATRNKILPANPTPRSNFSFTMQGSSGANIWGVALLLGFEARRSGEPTLNFRRLWVWLGAAGYTHIFHLYVSDDRYFLS
jgi:hypothetical protein